MVLQLSISSSYCQPDQVQPDPAIYQKWLHSYEEDTDTLKIYRPSTFDFPLGWGRDGMTIRKDGGFVLHDIAPNDAMVDITGHWKPITDARLEVSFPSSDKETFILQIEELNSKILKIKK